MAADRPPSDEASPEPDTARQRGNSTGGSTDESRSAREWLVAELRDECSDIGVSARGFDREGFRGVRTFACEARRLGAPAARMLVLLKQCLVHERLPRGDREVYQRYHDAAMTRAIAAYYEAPTDEASP